MNEMGSYIRQWLELAEGDFLSAKHLLTLYPHKLEVICYLDAPVPYVQGRGCRL